MLNRITTGRGLDRWNTKIDHVSFRQFRIDHIKMIMCKKWYQKLAYWEIYGGKTILTINYFFFWSLLLLFLERRAFVLSINAKLFFTFLYLDRNNTSENTSRTWNEEVNSLLSKVNPQVFWLVNLRMQDQTLYNKPPTAYKLWCYTR